MDWNGMDWNGLEWNGMEWNGMEWLKHLISIMVRIVRQQYQTISNNIKQYQILFDIVLLGYRIRTSDISIYYITTTVKCSTN